MDLRSRKLASCQSQDFGRPPGRRRIFGDRLPNKFEPKMTADYDPCLLHHCAEIFAKLLELMHSSLRLSNRYLLLCTSNLASSHRIETDVPLRSLFGQTQGPACRSSLLKPSTESRSLLLCEDVDNPQANTTQRHDIQGYIRPTVGSGCVLRVHVPFNNASIASQSVRLPAA